MEQLEKGLSSAEKKNSKPLELGEFKSSAGAGYESCKELLLLIGFNMDESADGNVTFPRDSDDGLLRCCTALAEVLVGEFMCDY